MTADGPDRGRGIAPFDAIVGRHAIGGIAQERDVLGAGVDHLVW